MHPIFQDFSPLWNIEILFGPSNQYCGPMFQELLGPAPSATQKLHLTLLAFTVWLGF